VSHDRAFLDRLTERLFLFDGTGASGILRNYEDYRSRCGGAGRCPPNGGRGPRRGGKNGLTFNERREYELLLSEIDSLEKEQKNLEEGFQRE